MVAPAVAGAEPEPDELPLGGDAADPGGLDPPGNAKPRPGTLPAPPVPVAPAQA